MNTIQQLSFLLLGIVRLVFANQRPDYVSSEILRDGCYPFVNWQCPAKMNCFVDLRQKKYGMCQCRPDYSLMTMYPTPEEEGSELAKLPHKSDCVGLGWVNIPAAGLFLFCVCVYLTIVTGSISMLKSVISKGGFKPNSSCIALVSIIIADTFAAIKVGNYFANRALLDNNWYWYDHIVVGFVTADTFDTIFTVLMNIEVYATWIDLLQKSVTMSKRTSLSMHILRSLLRAFAIGVSLLFMFQYWGLIPGGFGSNTQKILNDICQYTTIVFSCAGPLFGRVLCKNMKDVTNPNWKAASAIRLTGVYSIICTLSFNVSFNFLIMTGIWTHKGQFVGQTAMNTLVMSHAVHAWAIYQYLQFAHRRYTGDVHTSRLSQYFGFTTLGLKGSTRESSLASGKSSAASSTVATTSSAVSSASVPAASSTEGAAEGIGDGKGTMT